MLVIAAFAMASALAQDPSTGPVTETFRLAGREISVELPTKGLESLPGAAYTDHNGWRYLFGADGQALGRVRDRGSWSDLAALYRESKAKINAQTPVWHIKAFVYRRADILESSPEGVVRQRRYTLEESQIRSVLASLGRMAMAIDAVGGGRIKAAVDVEVEEEPLRPERFLVPGEFDLTEVTLDNRVRVNGRGYEAEDKTFRGPYPTVISLHPALASDGEGRFGTVAYDPNADGEPRTDLTAKLLREFWDSVAEASRQCGISVGQVDAISAIDGQIRTRLPQLVSTLPLQTLLTADVCPQEDYSRFASLKPGDDAAWPGLRETLAGMVPRYAKPSDSPFAEAFMEVPAPAPLARTFTFEGKNLAIVALSVADLFGAKAKPEYGWRPVGLVDGFRGGSYVVFELSRLPESTTPTDWMDVTLTPLDSPGQNTQTEPAVLPAGPSRYTLPEGTAPSSDAEASPESQALFLAQLTPEATPDQKTEAAKLIKNRSDLVRINACLAYQRMKDPSVVPALATLLSEFNPRVVEMAVAALKFQGTEDAITALKWGASSGRYDHVRGYAATALASYNDPKMAVPISTLLTGRGWWARRQGALALSQIKDPQVAIMRMAFLNDVSPEVRLAVVRGADINEEVVVKRLLWTSVNDASDAVRAASYLKLLESPNPDVWREGLKGTRDDGIDVRKAMAFAYTTMPGKAEILGSLASLGLSDPNPTVRAAHLAQMAVSKFSLSPQNLALVANDPDLRVQAALLDYALANGLQLPAETLDALKRHPEPGVRAALEKYGVGSK